MTLLEVLLILLGFVLVAISFLVSEKTKKESQEYKEESVSVAKELWTEKDEGLIRSRVEQVLGEKVDTLVDSAESRMSLISNDKIMAVDEFSQQVLEKIEQNHKEVVFMYNMLEDKEKELKKMSTVRSVAPPKKPVSRETAIHTLLKGKSNQAASLPSPEKPVVVQESLPFSSDASEVNERIRALHKAGKSVLEISKELDMGQGEVKLVIDLYGGK